jgi:pimeloyl-ACP methyl ester carboxylesterase
MTDALGVGSVRSADGTTIAFSTVGAGEPIVVVGGALRTAQDCLPFARALAKRFTVHVVDRRGLGASGPLGTDYSIDKECEDLLAVRATVDASRAFGHS